MDILVCTRRPHAVEVSQVVMRQNIEGIRQWCGGHVPFFTDHEVDYFTIPGDGRLDEPEFVELGDRVLRDVDGKFHKITNDDFIRDYLWSGETRG